mmetsp:Transcript_28465/g.54292  ORF Transcript_28465/g.54292 Transcript_28465/m.54292 type:complete len:261 (-) Transcript_28465:326-1108(-)
MCGHLLADPLLQAQVELVEAHLSVVVLVQLLEPRLGIAALELQIRHAQSEPHNEPLHLNRVQRAVVVRVELVENAAHSLRVERKVRVEQGVARLRRHLGHGGDGVQLHHLGARLLRLLLLQVRRYHLVHAVHGQREQTDEEGGVRGGGVLRVAEERGHLDDEVEEGGKQHGPAVVARGAVSGDAGARPVPTRVVLPQGAVPGHEGAVRARHQVAPPQRQRPRPRDGQQHNGGPRQRAHAHRHLFLRLSHGTAQARHGNDG